MQKWRVNRRNDVGYWLEYAFEHEVCSAEEAFGDFVMHRFRQSNYTADDECAKWISNQASNNMLWYKQLPALTPSFATM